MSNEHSASPDSLAAQVRQVADRGLPPVQDWNPDFCGDIDIRIARNGDWFYQGSIFTRPSLVRLFSTILRKDGDEYYLVTPVEKLRIQVEDAPFVVTAIDATQAQGHQQLWALTNTDDRFLIDAEHPLWVNCREGSDEPAPYVRVRDRLDGLLSRSVYYQLVELAEEREIQGRRCLGIESDGNFFVLGSLEQS